MANVTNYKKHGYFHGIEDLPELSQFKIACSRRANDVIKHFGASLSHDDLMARIYLQGLLDGK